jgi:hypothetical protein
VTDDASPVQLTHANVVYRAGGPKRVSQGLAEAGRAVTENAVSAWVSRNVIPAGYWHFFEKAGFATVAALDQASRAHREARQETRQGFRVPKPAAELEYSGSSRRAEQAAMGIRPPHLNGEEL